MLTARLKILIVLSALISGLMLSPVKAQMNENAGTSIQLTEEDFDQVATSNFVIF